MNCVNMSGDEIVATFAGVSEADMMRRKALPSRTRPTEDAPDLCKSQESARAPWRRAIQAAAIQGERVAGRGLGR